MEWVDRTADPRASDFEIWVHGWYVDGATSTFTLYTDELATDAGNITVSPVTAAADDPQVEVTVSWSGLVPSVQRYFGVIDHFVDGTAEPNWRSTLVDIDVGQ